MKSKKRIIRLEKEIYFHSYAAVGGYEESRGPRGKYFDHCDDTNKFQQKTETPQFLTKTSKFNVFSL